MPPASPQAHFAVALTPHADDPSKQAPEKQSNKWKKWFFGVPGILVGAALGIILGYVIQRAKPSEVTVSWIAMPGNLFIRAVKCLVSPLVFTSLIGGMADMMAAGKASSAGWRTICLYMGTTLLSTCEGVMWLSIFRPSFRVSSVQEADKVAAMAFQCDGPGYYLSHVNGTITCAYDAVHNATSSFSPASKFIATDINGFFTKASTGYTKRTLSAAVQGQLETLVPSNITTAFADGTILSIVMFAIPFGIAISLLPADVRVVGDFFRGVNTVLSTMVMWVINCTPIAIISLLSSAISEQVDLGVLVSSVGFYLLAKFCGYVFHTYVTYPILLRVFVRNINPYKWLFAMARAQIFAFGCASSMATLPIVIDCIDRTKKISRGLTRFVLTLGATIGMDGGAIGFPIATFFMAESAGLGHLIGTTEYILVIIASTIGAVGAGPVPAGGIVMVMTIWGSVFPSIPIPSTLSYIIACDWLTDRMSTPVNVTCDTVVCRIVAEWVGETTDEDNERASTVQEIASHNPELKDALKASDEKIDL